MSYEVKERFNCDIEIAFGSKVTIMGIVKRVPVCHGIIVSGVDDNGYVHVATERSEASGRPLAPDVEAIKVWHLAAGELPLTETAGE